MNQTASFLFRETLNTGQGQCQWQADGNFVKGKKSLLRPARFPQNTRQMKKRPEGLFSDFHSPSDWPTYSLGERYEENDQASTGKNQVLRFDFQQKKPRKRMRGQV